MKASLKGAAYRRDTAGVHADVVVAKGSKHGASHSLWHMAEINKLTRPTSGGIGMADSAEWDQRLNIAKETKNVYGTTVITEDPSDGAYANDVVEEALQELEGGGVDAKGYSSEPAEVTLGGGGQLTAARITRQCTGRSTEGCAGSGRVVGAEHSVTVAWTGAAIRGGRVIWAVCIAIRSSWGTAC